MDVDMEMGGNDQTFNMLAGRTLMKKMSGKEKFVLTTKLLTDPTGKKMGKTEGNVVNLDDKAENMFGKIMSWPDSLIIIAMETCTDAPMERIKQMGADMESEKLNPRDAKLCLAQDIVKIYRGENEAKEAQKYFIDTFSKREIPKEIRELKIKKEKIGLIDVLIISENAKSKGDARRKIEQGGVEIDGKKVTDWKMVLDKNFHNSTLKIGKHSFAKIKF
jgi:tyrosyl-tRNA synthetase